MKKYLTIFLVTAAVMLSNPSASFAAILYSNTFNNTLLSDWTIETSDGSVCSTNAGSLINGENTDCVIALNSFFNNLKCVSANIDTTNVSRDDFFMQTTSDFNNHAGNWSLSFEPNDGTRKINIFDTIDGITRSATINTPTGVHNYMFCQDSTNNTYVGYLDNVPIVSYTPVNFTIFTSLRLGENVLQTQNVNPINDFVITDTLPNPSPSPVQLSVPPLKQTDPAWTNLTYDLATIWSPHTYTIGTWGCALTSAAMVLNYYNIHNLPGTPVLPLNPGNLDAWLGTQPDGYVPNGNVNWLALARLTKQAKANNPTLPFDALQYSRSNFADTTTLLGDLNAGQPDILEEPGHFVVATGKNSSNVFTINDPYYSNTTLAAYGNTFLSLGRYIPSFTDLSYLLFTSDPSLTLSLKNGVSATGSSYVQQPLQGDGAALTAGNPIQLLYLQQPQSGNYTLTISGSTNQTYSVTGYLYDKNGNVKPFTQTGVVDPNNQNIVSLTFDNQNINNDTTQKIVTFDVLLADIQDLYKLNHIKLVTYAQLKGLTLAGKASSHNKMATKTILGLINSLLKAEKGKGIDTTAYQILPADIQYLQSH